MQIGKLNLGPAAAPIFGSKSEQFGLQLGETPLAQQSGGADPNPATVATYREILSQYDVTNITAVQFSQLLHELHSAGAIDDAELQELGGIRFELDRAGVESDEPVNLLDLFAARVQNLLDSVEAAATGREENDQPPDERVANIELAKRQLEWLQKFATVHAESSDAGVNTLV